MVKKVFDDDSLYSVGKFADIILYLEEGSNYATKISGMTDITYAHVNIVIKSLVTRGLAESYRRGRSNMITLTSEGMVLANHLRGAKELLGQKTIYKKRNAYTWWNEQ